MNSLEILHNFDQFKTLSDPRRLAILRLLMAKPATLTQLGRSMGEHPAWVRHHIKKLEESGLVEISSTQITGGFVEKYYSAKANALLIQEMILPQSPQVRTVVLMGSHDIALERLAWQLVQKQAGVNLLVLPVGSLDGLVALRQGFAHLTGCHLLDPENGDYNRPYVRHIFPDRDISMVTVAEREQGLILPPGNPLRLHKIEDLVGPEVRFANRMCGSGTRLWLDQRLRKEGIHPAQINDYTKEWPTHTAVARAISLGEANAGLGLHAAARQYDLDFIPLFTERYDLVIPTERFHDPRLAPIFEDLQSLEFRKSLKDLSGYDTEATGMPLSVSEHF